MGRSLPMEGQRILSFMREAEKMKFFGETIEDDEEEEEKKAQTRKLMTTSKNVKVKQKNWSRRKI
jgi:hypothetical protein